MDDFAQLTPVHDEPLYSSKSDISDYQVTGKLFKKFKKKTIIFDEQIRQGEDQKQFVELLNRLSSGEFTLKTGTS